MRILFVCGGGAVYGKELLTLSLMKGLKDRKHQVMCVTSSWGDDDFTKRLDEESIPSASAALGFLSKTFTLSALTMTLDQLRRLPSLWIKYRKLVKSFRPEVVVHTNFHHLVLSWPLLGGPKNIFHVHECFPATKFYKAILKLVSTRLSLMIGVSRFVASSLASLGLSNHKIDFVLNGISWPALSNQTTQITRTHETSPVAVGIVGQVGEWKGHEDLVDALLLMKRKGVEFVCKIFGDGDPTYTAKLKSKILEFGLASEIKWEGFVGDQRLIYSLIDLCVVPTRAFEPFGLVAAEAAFCGLPVVATDRGGLSEIVVDQRTGYLVPGSSSDQLAEKLRCLVESKRLRYEMGEAAKQHAWENLTSLRMVEQFEERLTSVL